MSNNILNDISSVYMEQVASAVDEATKAKPDYLDFDSDGNEKEPMKKALKDKAKQKVEEAKKANDGNLANNYPPYGKVTRGDVIAGRLGRDQMGGKKKVTKEGYSNWRFDLSEVMDDTSNLNSSGNSKVKEKKVNNTIKINPSLNAGMKESIESLGGELLEMVEIEEEYITEEIEIATEYFYKEGLNEDGIDILIEKLGLEEFVNFVSDLSEEYILTEASETRLQKMAAKKNKILVGPKGSKPQSTTKAAIKKMGGITKKIGSSQKPSSTISKERKVAVKTAVAKQPDKKPVRDAIARGILGAVNAYKAGMERHKAATATASRLAKETGKTIGKASKGVGHVAKEFGSGVTATGTAAKKVKTAVVGEEITPKTSEDQNKTQQIQKPDPVAQARQKQLVQIQKKQTMDRMLQLNKGFPVTSESSEDSARDSAMERGGMGANPRQSYKPNTTPSKKRTPEEIKASNDKVMDVIRKRITAQYGKAALM